MAESTVGWFVVREKYCSLAEKVRLISPANKAINKKYSVSWSKSKEKRATDLDYNGVDSIQWRPDMKMKNHVHKSKLGV